MNVLLAMSPFGIIVTDSENQVYLWNAQAEALFGYSAAEALGRQLPIRPAAGSLAAQLSAAELNPIDAVFLHRDGSLAEVSLWSAMVPGADVPVPPARLIMVCDIAERKFLERALLGAIESESRRLGMELHDHLSQQLLGAAFGTIALASRLKRDGSPHAAALEQLATTINDAVVETRSIARGLNPVELDSAGLDAALRDLVERVSAAIPCLMECARPVLLANATSALHAYRIAQEAASNALTHSGARQITISLSEARDQVTLEIHDDGCGFDAASASETGIGLSCIKYRARALGGTLRIDSGPNSGTLVVCEFPKSP